MEPLTIQKTFSVPSGAELCLSNIRGPISIHTGPDGEIAVEATKKPATGQADRTRIEMEQDRSDTVRVETRFDQRGQWGILDGRKEPCEVEYRIQVPRRCAVTISTVSSETTLTGLTGAIKVSTVSGEVRANSLDGDIQLSSISGDLSGIGLAGNLKFECVSGDLNLRHCRLSTLKGSAVSGDMYLQLAQAPDTAAVDTVSGDVHLALPDEASVTLELASMSGRILAGAPYTRTSNPARRQTATLGAGGPPFTVSSVSGDLIASRSETDAAWPEPAPSVSGAAPSRPPDATQPDRVETPPALSSLPDAMSILESIERGELTVDEGLNALES